MYLINDPWTIKVSVLRGLPPTEASGRCTGTQWDLQSYQASLVTVVAEEKFLEEPPGETSIHRELQQDRLGARVRSRLPTAKTEEELDEPTENGH